MPFYKGIKFLLLCIGLCFIQKAGAQAPEADLHAGGATFIENAGQWNNHSKFLVNLRNAELYIENNAFQYFFENPEDVADFFRHPRPFEEMLLKQKTIRMHAVRVSFEGSNADAPCIGDDPEETYYNFFSGNEPRFWKGNVHGYQSVWTRKLYRETDLHVYTSESGTLKYDLVLMPGSDPAQIQMKYEGADQIYLEKGLLHVKTSVNKWMELAPYAYQVIDGKQVAVPCHFMLDDQQRVSFSVGDYDRSKNLVIDPELVFGTYSGSTANNFGHTATYDNDGNLYAAGILRKRSPSENYPVTAGAFQVIWGGGDGSWPQPNFPCDISISKYNNDGSKLIYATYLGGSRNDYPNSIVVDNEGHLIVLGTTLSSDFPTTQTAYNRVGYDSFDIVLTKFSTDGSSLIGSTYVGGSGIDGLNIADSLRMNYADEFRGEVQVKPNGDIVVVSSTTSGDFPIIAGALQPLKSGRQDGIIFIMDSTLSNVKRSTFLGRSNHDALNSLDLDAAGNIYFAGGTQSTDFPVPPNQFSAGYHGGIADGFTGVINANLSVLKAFRYWGSAAYDQAYFVKLDPAGNIAVMGQNYDTIPVTPGTYRNAGGSLFISKFRPTLDSLIFSTRIGNGNKENALSPSAFMIDVCGRVYGSVWGGATNFFSHYANDTNHTFVSSTHGLPVTANALYPGTDGSDFYLFVLSPNADTLNYTTFFGDRNDGDHVDGGTSRFDKKGIVYQSVCASCNTGFNGTFPTTPGSYSPKNKNIQCSNASFKLDFRQGNVLVADFEIRPRNTCTDSIVKFINTSYNGKYFYWYLDGVLVDSSANYTDTFTVTGNHTMKLVTIDSARCQIRDSITKTFNVQVSSQADFEVRRDTCGPTLYFTNKTTSFNNIPVDFIWDFGDGHTSVLKDPTHVYASAGSYTVKLITSRGTVCADTAKQQIIYDPTDHVLKADFTTGRTDTLICGFTQLQLRSTGINGQHFYWYVNDSLVSTSAAGFDTIVLKGIFDFKLVVVDSTTCLMTDSMQRRVRVVPEVFADFKWKRDSCSFNVFFEDSLGQDYGDSINYLWYFGDGDSSFLQKPVHTFPYGGNFTVKLYINKGVNLCEHSRSYTIRLDTLSGILESRFSTNPAVGCSPAIIRFENSSINGASFQWYFDDVLVQSHTGHQTFLDTFPYPDTVDVKLIAYDPLSCARYDTLVKQLVIQPSVEASFTVKRDSCTPDLHFKSAAVSDPAGFPVNYLWDMGDGNTNNFDSFSFVYANSGTYKVVMIANPGACADTVTQDVVYNAEQHLLRASFTLEDSTLCLPAYLHANNQSVNGKYFYWYINDQLTDTARNLFDTITTQGTYTVRLVVIDSLTCLVNDTFEKKIEIAPYAKSDFVANRDSCSLEVHFTNLSSGSGVPFIWYFGDGDSSVEASPVHQYQQTDYYTVRLVYSPETFCADTAERIYFFDGDTIKELIIPNVFTPNGDGVNDCYEVRGISPKCDEFHIWIYNRWGNLFYESTNASACWNGKNEQGEPASEGVYFYVMKIKKRSIGLDAEKHGTITLITD